MEEEEFIKDLQLDFNIQLWKFKRYNEEYNKLKIDIKDAKTSNEIKTKFGIISPEKYEVKDILQQIESLYYAYKFAGSGAIAEKIKEQLWFLIGLIIWDIYY